MASNFLLVNLLPTNLHKKKQGTLSGKFLFFSARLKSILGGLDPLSDPVVMRGCSLNPSDKALRKHAKLVCLAAASQCVYTLPAGLVFYTRNTTRSMFFVIFKHFFLNGRIAINQIIN